ncbi:PQQ-binding-like beta-propeller repeat protein [Isoptericola variabilis]|uniref:Pyrrolo-quinoline quinone repeat-containing protein n=1 Tax=Isoptericola variabilis (strain 225) TaxID=743718 RepID=F6FW64_ISOV2|nr:PQQ-binding-like beta-propeller repeat protein [Isoptericola variabilis]AEG45608.1 hypothetical protein Isova_2923 [Isoptericola variabilis 225]TWH25784.1 putative pyrroloquinoline-quinone binding quinoprotein [Isoptericola variabilis J7]
MARRRGAPDPYTFDLVPGDEVDGSAPDVVGERTLDAAYGAEDVMVEPAAGGLLAVLRLEDATTGEVVVELDAPFTPVSQLWECSHGILEDGDVIVAEFGRGQLVASPLVVEHSHCGVDVATAADGTDLTEASGDVRTGFGWYGVGGRMPYPDGGVVATDDEGRSRLVDDEGEVVLEVVGTIVVPRATDGAPTDVVLVDTHDGSMVAVDRDGSELWRVSVPYANAIVRADGVFLVGGFDGLLALDLRTGAERWRTSGEFTDPGAILVPATGAATDGRTALLSATTHDMASGRVGTALVAVDLTTGDVAPVEVDGAEWETLVTVDGHPLLLTAELDRTNGLRGLTAERVRGLGRQ